MISLICPTYRNPKFLDLFLKSAVENKTHPDTEVIVIVDGYVEESQEVLAKYEVAVLELPQNKGMQFAINVGVAQANNPYVFVVNDDNVMPKQWDTRLIEQVLHCEKLYDSRWVLTVDQIEPTGPGMFMFPVLDLGTTVETFQYDAWLDAEFVRAEIVLDEIYEDGHIFPFVVAKKYYMAIGGMDTFYNSPNICDWDMFLKFELLDFRFPRTRGMRLYHFGSVATKKNKDAPEFRDKERIAFDTYTWKWGAAPHNTLGTNSKIPRDRKFRGFTA